MSVYHVLVNAKAVSTLPPFPVEPWGSDYNSSSPPQKQSWTVKLSGVGNCSATIQPVVSNGGDPASFQPFGPALTVTAASADVTPGWGNIGTNGTFAFYGAIVTAISGTAASVNCDLSC
jgi:hypothetical protein